MPVPLGTFISREVYDEKLHSQHKINHMSCISFVDVAKGSELNSGFSWTVSVRALEFALLLLMRIVIWSQNLEEIQTIVHLVHHYYKSRRFCVITPYDAQRAAIERQLKAEFLPWERVFNVDSFQG